MRAFLSAAPTIAKRIVRAKAKIRETRIPYEVPARSELPDRLDTVLQVIYLVFTEGCSASAAASLTRLDLSSEAIRLGRLLSELLPEPEALGLAPISNCSDWRSASKPLTCARKNSSRTGSGQAPRLFQSASAPPPGGLQDRIAMPASSLAIPRILQM
jgi:Family of unknown function (DUF6596)